MPLISGNSHLALHEPLWLQYLGPNASRIGQWIPLGHCYRCTLDTVIAAAMGNWTEGPCFGKEICPGQFEVGTIGVKRLVQVLMHVHKHPIILYTRLADLNSILGVQRQTSVKACVLALGIPGDSYVVPCWVVYSNPI